VTLLERNGMKAERPFKIERNKKSGEVRLVFQGKVASAGTGKNLVVQDVPVAE